MEIMKKYQEIIKDKSEQNLETIKIRKGIEF